MIWRFATESVPSNYISGTKPTDNHSFTGTPFSMFCEMM